MPPGRLFSLHVSARMLDFFDERAHWQRRLWNVGLVLSLREILEAGEELNRSLSGAAVRTLADTVASHVRVDPGAGSEAQREALIGYLGRELHAGGFGHHAIEVAHAEIEPCYLDRWHAAVNSDPGPGREETARALASHLLDAGLAPAHLRRWLSALKADDPDLPISDLIEAAKAVIATETARHELFLPFEVEPRIRGAKPTHWIDSKRAADWLEANGHSRLQQRGGFLLGFDARSPEEAVAKAADAADRFVSRVGIGVRSEARFQTIAYLNGAKTINLPRGRSVEVRALEREEVVGELESAGVVDAAIELLSHLQHGPAPVAVAGGWSAIESLLTGPGDEGKNVAAADRLAGLVACSFPRAELTDLAWARIRAADDDLSKELDLLGTNREKAARFAEELANTVKNPGLRWGSDIAAQHRMRQLLADPCTQLADVRKHATESLRRLYRQRNLVLHGGRTDAVALGACLRTSAPLVGAGFDRIVHGTLVKSVEPLRLAARADFELARIEPGSVAMLVDMLE